MNKKTIFPSIFISLLLASCGARIEESSSSSFSSSSDSTSSKEITSSEPLISSSSEEESSSIIHTKKLVLSSSGAPSSSLGKDYDIYVNEDNLDVYCKEEGRWLPTESKASSRILGEHIEGEETNILSSLINAFYRTNIIATCSLFTSGLTGSKGELVYSNGSLNMEVTTYNWNVDKWEEMPEKQHHSVIYENNKYYLVKDNEDDVEIDKSSHYYILASNSFDQYFARSMNIPSFVNELIPIALKEKDTLEVKLDLEGHKQTVTFSDFSFSYLHDHTYLKEISFKNIENNVDYHMTFSW